MNDANPNDESSFAADLINIIQTSKIFSEIDRTALEVLLPRLEKVTLHQGEALFEQGDSSDCLYILVDGHLIASLLTSEGKQKIVGSIERGETIGELGALSNQPRTLTVRSATDCRLLKLSQKIFNEFGKTQPKFVARIIDLIIQRSQNTLKIISQRKLYQHIAIIQGNKYVSLDKLIKKIKENFRDDSLFILQLDIPEGTLLTPILEQAELNGQSVIFILDQNNVADLKTKLNHIGGIFVFVDGDTQGWLSEFAFTMLSKFKTPFATQYELVLLHDDNIENPTGTLAWLNQAEFTAHHHIRINNNIDYQRLLRFMLGIDSMIIAVSLSGSNESIVRYNFPPILSFRIGLLKKLKLAYKEYNFPPFLNTFLQAMLLGSSAKEKMNQLAADILICPDLSQFGSFDVSTKKSNELIELGYHLTYESIKQFSHCKKGFKLNNI